VSVWCRKTTLRSVIMIVKWLICGKEMRSLAGIECVQSNPVFLARHGGFEQYVSAGVYSLLSMLIKESHAHMFSEVSSWKN